MSWYDLGASIGARCFAILDSNGALLYLMVLLLFGIGHVRIHVDLLLDGLRVVQDLLAVTMV